MLCCLCYEFYNLFITLYNFTDEDIKKINARSNKNDLYLDYI